MTEPSTSDKGYQRSLEVHQRIEALYPRIEQYGARFRAITPVDRSFPLPPGRTPGVRLDPTVCALAIKAATTKRAVLALCELGDGDNALALTRVLLENACLLEWLIRGGGRRRLEAYLMFMSVEHERIAATIDRHKARFIAHGAANDVPSDPYHRAVWTHTFRLTKEHRPTWRFEPYTGKGEPVRVHDLFREIADAAHSYEHDVLYGTLGSDIVHSGPFSLTRIQQSLLDRNTFVLQSTPVSGLRTIALAVSNSAMFLVLDSLSEYVGLNLSAELDALKMSANADPYAPKEESNG